MFNNLNGKTTNKMKQAKFVRLLGTLVAALPSFALIAEKDAKDMVSSEPTFLSINPNVAADAQGNVQAFALPPGVAAFNANPAPAATAAPAENATEAAATETFEISSDVVLPSIKRGGNKGGRESKYPFMKLEIGQSFFVATTPKAFASTLSGGNRKGKKETPIRRFTLRSATVASGDKGAVAAGKDGIRVWRVEPPAPKAAKVATAGTEQKA